MSEILTRVRAVQVATYLAEESYDGGATWVRRGPRFWTPDDADEFNRDNPEPAATLMDWDLSPG